jgi:hypothetical protein
LLDGVAVRAAAPNTFGGEVREKDWGTNVREGEDGCVSADRNERIVEGLVGGIEGGKSERDIVRAAAEGGGGESKEVKEEGDEQGWIHR